MSGRAASAVANRRMCFAWDGFTGAFAGRPRACRVGLTFPGTRWPTLGHGLVGTGTQCPVPGPGISLPGLGSAPVRLGPPDATAPTRRHPAGSGRLRGLVPDLRPGDRCPARVRTAVWSATRSSSRSITCTHVRSRVQARRGWPPTPLADSIDSSSISWSHNNLGRRFLEV